VPLRIDVWSDVVCPWCAIGRARLHKALAAGGVEAEVHHRAFELDPNHEGTRPTHEVLRERYGPDAPVEEMTERVRLLGAAEGLDLRPAQALAANTFDAHRLLAWAGSQGRSVQLMDALVAAHFAKSKDVSDRGVLEEAARTIGLDAAEARRVLESGDWADEVRQDEAMAQELGIRGVPFFVLEGRIGISGAQPVEAFRQALASLG
jgi:predicted DsbA family dithiol-disulfide isomerase